MALNPLRLELKTVVIHHVGTGNQTRGLWFDSLLALQPPLLIISYCGHESVIIFIPQFLKEGQVGLVELTSNPCTLKSQAGGLPWAEGQPDLQQKVLSH